eukprot:TRINITY_DN61719_c0_g1_i1.p1 TRINITY_DN61719_c0_g1~~TRINITY_DN61719_c0_g1_i1.p1  ORF type:complete len:479 (+),score=72.87 TRINITY_DN61719_c0_g1_i1:127-1437(+)
MLEEEGYYENLCEHPDPSQPCEGQLEALNNAYTLAASSFSLTSFCNGYLVDAFGPRKVAMLAGVVNLVGFIGLALTKAVPWGFDIFFWSTLLVAVGGSLTMFIGYKAPFLVPSHFTLLVAINACLFDAGAIIFSILKIFYDLGVPLAVFFWAYAVLSFMCFALLATAWGMNEVELQKIREAEDEDTTDTDPEKRSLVQQGLVAQLKSFEFAAILIYCLLMIPRSITYLGTVSLINDNIAKLDRLQDKWVSTVTGFIIPFSFLAVPAIKMSLQRLGTIATIQLTTFLGLAWSALQMIPDLYLQLLTVIVFAAWRAFLYSGITAFAGETFGEKAMGRIMGLCFFFSGLVSMLVGHIVDLAVAANNFTPLLLEDLLVCIPIFLIFIVLRIKQLPAKGETHSLSWRGRAVNLAPKALTRSKNLGDIDLECAGNHGTPVPM